MIKAEAEKGKLRLEASGSFPELMAEFTCIASAFFEKISPEIPFEKKMARFVTALAVGEKAKQGGISMEDKKYAEIKVTYEDGTEKTIERGTVFSVREEGDSVFVSCEAFPDTNEDLVAVLAIVSRMAKEAGIDEALIGKAEEIEDEV